MELALTVEQRFGFYRRSGAGEPRPVLGAGAGFGGQKADQAAARRVVHSRAAATSGSEATRFRQAFVEAVLRRKRDVVAADDLAGAITYERLLVGALVLSRRFAALASPNVGLLLPASVGCDLAFMGLHLAGKLPVVLNWTTGPANLAHAVEAACA